MRRVTLAALVLLLAGSCGASEPSGPVTPTQNAHDALDDESGALLARAYAEHPPTVSDVKLAAAAWAFVLASHQSGSVDPALLQSGLFDEVLALAAQYPSFFVGTPGRTSAPLTDCAAPPTCDGDCALPWGELAGPAVEIGSNTLSSVAVGVGVPASLVGITGAFQTALGFATPPRDAADAAPFELAEELVLRVGMAVAGGATLANASATLLGAGATAVAAAEVAAILGIGLLAYQLADAAHTLSSCVASCLSHQAAECDDACGSTCPTDRVCRSCGGQPACHATATTCCGTGACNAALEQCVPCPQGRLCLPLGSTEADCPDPCPTGSTYFSCNGEGGCVTAPMVCCDRAVVAGTECPQCAMTCTEGTTCVTCGASASCETPGGTCCEDGVTIECAPDERCGECGGRSVCIREGDVCCRGMSADSGTVCAAGACLSCAPFGSVCTPDGASNWFCCPGEPRACPIGTTCVSDGCMTM